MFSASQSNPVFGTTPPLPVAQSTLPAPVTNVSSGLTFDALDADLSQYPVSSVANRTRSQRAKRGYKFPSPTAVVPPAAPPAVPAPDPEIEGEAAEPDAIDPDDDKGAPSQHEEAPIVVDSDNDERSPEPQPDAEVPPNVMAGRAQSVRGPGATRREGWYLDTMSDEMLNAQLAEFENECVVYGCRETGKSILQTEVYCGKLKRKDDGYVVISSPAVQALYAISADVDTIYPIPCAGYEYSFILGAGDWNMDRAAEWRLSHPDRSKKQKPPVTASRLPKAVVPEDLFEGLEDEEDEPLSHGNFALNETTAQDPAVWPQVIRDQADLIQLKIILMSVFPVSPDRKKDASVTKDCIKMCICIAQAMWSMEDSSGLTALTTAAKTAIKRLFLIQLAADGRSASFIEHFSNAADGEERPDWIRKSEIRAAQLVKNLAESRPTPTHKFNGARPNKPGPKGKKSE